MICNRLQLVPKLGLPLKIVESFCLVQLLPQIAQSASVFRLSPCVQHWEPDIEFLREASNRGDCCSRN